MVSHWDLSDSQSPQFSGVLLSILTDLYNAVVWVISSHPLISKSSSPYVNPLVSVPRAPITIGITVTFMFHSFSNSLARLKYLSFFWFSFNHTLWSAETGESTIRQVHFFLLIITRSGGLAEIWWSVFVSKSQRSLCISFTRTDSDLCTYHLFVWLNSNFLHNSQWITLPTQSYLVLYFFCASLLHSFIMWLTVSSISPLIYIWCFVASYLFLL